MLSYTDPSRTTFSYTTGKRTNGRTIKVELRYPATVKVQPVGGTAADAPITHGAPRIPSVVFAPGYRLGPSDYDALLDGWVHAGYIVASVEFPNTTAPVCPTPHAAANLPTAIPRTICSPSRRISRSLSSR